MTAIPRSNPTHDTLYNLHKSFGITVFALAFLRLGLKLKLGAPPFPSVIPRIEQWLATLGHWALYGFMFLMPVSGYVMSASYGLPVKWFGLPIPRLVSIDKARGVLAGEIHQFAAYSLIVMIMLHVGAVIQHFLIHRLNLLKRMV